jgi:hypothetical protein
MPQITCPNCGMTINLENRREIDFNLIKGAASKSPRTFTEFLHITKLSRKTLSLRLKELCRNGALVKREGVYKLNEALEFKDNGRDLMKGLSSVLSNRRMRVCLMLITFLLGSSVSGYVLAAFLVKPQFPQRQAIGNFMMSFNVSDVENLYAWQIVIAFNSSELEVEKVTSGNVVGTAYPFFVNATDVGEGALLLGGSLFGSVPGKNISDSRRLATIVFGYFVDQYEDPEIIPRIGWFETLLLDSEGSLIVDSSSIIEHLQLLESHE